MTVCPSTKTQLIFDTVTHEIAWNIARIWGRRLGGPLFPASAPVRSRQDEELEFGYSEVIEVAAAENLRVQRIEI